MLRSFTPDRLRAFYTKWYRPDRMAVIVVGDVDPAAMESMIRAEFGALAKPATPAPDRIYDVPLQAELLIKVATDPEAQQSSVSLVRKKAALPQDRVADYRRDLVHRLVFQMINDRFDELSRKPDAQFLGAGADESRLSPTVGTFTHECGGRKRQAAGRALRARDRSQAGQGVRLRCGRARARAEVDAGVYERAYTERDKTRERIVRPGVREPLPRRRTEPRDRLRVPARQGLDPGNHRRGGRRRGPAALLGREPRDPRGFAAEGRRRRPDRCAAA